MLTNTLLTSLHLLFFRPFFELAPRLRDFEAFERDEPELFSAPSEAELPSVIIPLCAFLTGETPPFPMDALINDNFILSSFLQAYSVPYQNFQNRIFISLRFRLRLYTLK